MNKRLKVYSIFELKTTIVFWPIWKIQPKVANKKIQIFPEKNTDHMLSVT